MLKSNLQVSNIVTFPYRKNHHNGCWQKLNQYPIWDPPKVPTHQEIHPGYGKTHTPRYPHFLHSTRTGNTPTWMNIPRTQCLNPPGMNPKLAPTMPQLWTSLRHPNEPHSLKAHHLIPTFLLQSWSRGSHIYQDHTTMRQKFKSILIWNRKKSLPFNPVWHPQETKPSMDTLN